MVHKYYIMYLLHTVIHGQQRLQSLALQHVGELHVNGLHGAGVTHNPVFVWIRGVIITGRSERRRKEWQSVSGPAGAWLREIESFQSFSRHCLSTAFCWCWRKAHRQILTAGMMCLCECVKCERVCLHGQNYKWQQSTVRSLSRLLENDTLQFNSLMVS